MSSEQTLSAYHVTPEMYGAEGDGMTNDTQAFRSALDAAGEYAVVNGTPGATYLIDGDLPPQRGQQLIGNGARLKRIDQVSATTTNSVGGNAPITINVDDASVFRVGASIAVTKNGTTDPHSHRISAIDGNSLTVESDFTESFTSGATVLSGFTVLHVDEPRVQIRGWEIDGNSANYADAGRRWEFDDEIIFASTDGVVAHNHIHDAVCEGMQIKGDRVQARNNYIHDCAGNGIHYSGTTGAVVMHNWIENTQQWANEDPGHQDGCITLSNEVFDCYTAHNILINGKSALGSIDNPSNDRNTFHDNTGKNCDTPFDMVVNDTGIEWTRFTDNSWFSCGTGAVKSATANPANDSERNLRTLFRGNFFYDTFIHLDQANYVEFAGNIMRAPQPDDILIYITEGSDLQIKDNDFEGASYAIYAASYSEQSSRYHISGNTCRNQSAAGIQVGNLGGTQLVVSDNIISAGPDAEANYRGIYDKSGKAFIIGNNVKSVPALTGIRGDSGTIITANKVRTSGDGYSIYLDGGATGATVVHNFVNTPVVDDGSANIVESNYVSG